MTRILVVGSSHVAALKAAHDLYASDFPQVEFSFFAANVKYFNELAIDANGTLYPPQPKLKLVGPAGNISDQLMRLNGATSCDLTAADVVIWCGFVSGQAETLTPHHPILQLLYASDIRGLRETGNPRLIGRRTFDALIKGQARHMALPPEWRRPGLPPVVALIPPAPTEAVRDMPRPQLRFLQELQLEPQGCKEALSAYIDAIEAVLAEQGIPMIRQPEETLDEMGLTRAAYNSNPVSTAKQAASSDPNHMNADYGRLCLRAIVERVGSLTT